MKFRLMKILKYIQHCIFLLGVACLFFYGVIIIAHGASYTSREKPIASQEKFCEVLNAKRHFEMEFKALVDAQYDIIFKPIKTKELNWNKYKLINDSPVFDSTALIKISSNENTIKLVSKNLSTDDVFKMYLLSWYAVLGEVRIDRGKYKLEILWEDVPTPFSGYIQVIPLQWNYEFTQKLAFIFEVLYAGFLLLVIVIYFKWQLRGRK